MEYSIKMYMTSKWLLYSVEASAASFFTKNSKKISLIFIIRLADLFQWEKPTEISNIECNTLFCRLCFSIQLTISMLICHNKQKYANFQP